MAEEKGLYQKTLTGKKQDGSLYHANKIFMPESCAVATYYGDDLSLYLKANSPVNVLFNVNWQKSSVYVTGVEAI